MSEIVPSIIAKRFDEVKAKAVVLEGEAAWAHLDIMDGRFVGGVSWDAPDDLENLDGRLRLEAHLMVDDPRETLALWIKYVDRLLIHYEVTDNLPEVLEATKNNHCQLGLVLKLETDLNVLDLYLPELSFIQLMSIPKLGHYHGDFSEKIYDRIKTLRAKWPNGTISVDGGITLDSAQKLLDAGATQLVIGGAIWDTPDPLAALKQFQALVPYGQHSSH